MTQNFPKRSLRRIKDSVRKTDALSKQVAQVVRGSSSILQGLLKEDLTAPADFGDDPTEVELQVWVKKDGKLTQPTTEVTITIKNHDPGLERNQGTYCIVQQIAGEWQIIYCGCEDETYEDKL